MTKRGRAITYGRGSWRLWNDGDLDGFSETGERTPRTMHENTAHSKIKSLKRGDFTPEEAAELQRLYGNGPTRRR